ncbi:MAG: hypothetical protein MZV63_20225 [Marinilabiliales bacterium]|nr:hypothetical protein [Marinilabiliales bacterium]
MSSSGSSDLSAGADTGADISSRFFTGEVHEHLLSQAAQGQGPHHHHGKSLTEPPSYEFTSLDEMHLSGIFSDMAITVPGEEALPA